MPTEPIWGLAVQRIERVLRKRLNPPRDLFPIDPWRLEINRFDRRLASELVGPGETAFALSNGYLGMRGNHEEDRPIREAGTYLNGFYEHRPIVYGEHAYGFPKAGQTMLNCPDGKIIKLYVDDEPFDLETAELVSFNRRLEMREGTLRREIVFLTPTGKRIRLASCRLVSFHHRHLAAIRYEIIVEDAEADLVISSEMINRQPLPVQTSDPRMAEGMVGRVLQPAGRLAEGLRAILSFTTSSSGLTFGCGMEHAIETGCAFTADVRCEDDFAAAVFKVRGEAGKPVRILKFLSYHYGERTTPREIRAQTAWTLDRALEEGFDTVLERQRAYVAAFWERADVEVEGGATPEKQQFIRWNLFQLLQASARAEGHGIGARGLTGQTYEGHYFWDTEIYVLPFLIYTNPPMARSILKFRYDQLDKARARARELGHPGATFPWRTIDGHEASAYYAAGTAQYHINADIVYAIRKYVEATGDEAFLREYGAEILIETARFWVDLGGYIDRQERRFCINGVTGPDEYTAVVNNNYFTNIMARENLRYACETVRSLQTLRPEVFERLKAKTGFEDKEARGVGDGGAADVSSLRCDARHPPPGRQLPRQGDLGFREYARDQLPPAVVLPSPQSLSASGHQTGGHPPGDVSPRRSVQRGSEEEELRLLRPSDHARLVAVRLHPEHHRQRDRVRRQGSGILRLRGGDGSVGRRREHDERRPYRVDRRQLDVPGLRLRGHARLRRRNVVPAALAGRLDEAALPADGARQLSSTSIFVGTRRPTRSMKEPD